MENKTLVHIKKLKGGNIETKTPKRRREEQLSWNWISSYNFFFLLAIFFKYVKLHTKTYFSSKNSFKNKYYNYQSDSNEIS